ncbi:MAG: putative LPS assembly protein LptD [candidate division WOR-3 bacterium]|nr:putative LPS assembly protein LptD [candidate division WOR-3 bacterium]MCX7948325.1 putative LPS assembly protein LptD [candidate division WOR-3 bacterium]MDW8150847.1 putative LPS assembly protein LptD [candidate division WOR-3 bacterium]
MFIIFAQIDTNKVFFKGKELIYISDSAKVILYDSAYVKRGNVQLYADTIEYSLNSKTIRAKSRFLLIIDTSKITGDSLIYFLDGQDGIAFHTRNFVQKGWLNSNKLYKLKGDTLYIKDGFFTTCDLNIPHSAFYGTEMLAIRGDMALVKNVVLKIRDIPILYSPFWIFPLKEERSSGFLTPSFGFNSIDGKYIRNIAFYWVINNYADMSFYMDIVERQGIRFGINTVYNVYKKFNGNINFNFSNDFVFRAVRRRYSLEGNHNQEVYRFRTASRYFIVSDQSYFQDYAENKDQWLKTETYSYFQISRNFFFGGFSSNFDYTKNLITGQASSNLPNIILTINSFSFLGILITQSSSFNQSILIDSLNNRYTSQSFAYNLSLTRPINILQNLKLSNSLSLPFSAKRAHNDSIWKKSLNMNYSSSISTTIYGRSVFSIWKIERFYHDITPSIGINYSRSLFDTIPVSFSYSYSILNQFSIKFQNRKYSVGTLSFSGSYNPSFDLPFSPLSISLILPRFLNISASFSTTYNYYTKNFSEILGNFSYSQTIFGYSISASLSTPQNILNFSISGKLTNKWSFSYSFSRDFNLGIVQGQSISLSRDLHEWKADISYSSIGIFSSYDFKIYLTAIPEIRLTRGLFNLFFPLR